MDNGAHSPHAGDVFLAYDDPKGAYDLWGFGGLGYPATAPLPEFLLSVAREGTGSGTVTSVPTGIDCGLDCSEKYEEGTTVILTTHNKGVIDSIGRRVITMQDGKVLRDDESGKYIL